MPACPDEVELENWRRGDLAPARADALSAHVAACESCRSSVEELHADASLLGQVRRVLSEDDGAVDATLSPGTAVAGFRLVREIGRGGMGSVWEAEQDKPRRRVAFKVVRPGRVSARALRRLEHEAEVLARLQHRGIAQVFAAGTFATAPGPQPWFAMELIEGTPLLQHAARLEVVAKVGLLVEICDAVQHAHQKGVIHRDLKPQNVLVDAAGQPKVLDFGVARAEMAGGAAAARDTLEGLLIGTIAYMSPEQAAGDPRRDVDTRTDVWGLGAIAFELLTGRLPHDLEGATIAQALRRIAHEQPRPLGAVDPRLRGDLAAVVGKALATDKERRYPSAAELARDLERYLRQEPVAARPPSVAYQVQRFAQRHFALVLAGAAVVASLAVGLAVAWTQANRARRAEREASARADEAERQLQIAKGTKDFLQEVLVLASPAEQGGEPPTIQRALQIALERVDHHLIEQPAVEGAVRHVLGEILLAMGKHDEADVHLRRALALYEAEYGGQHRQVLYVLSHLGRNLMQQGRFADAERTLQRALAMRHPVDARTAAIVGGALDTLGQIYYSQGRLADAERALREELAAFALIEAEHKRRSNIAIATGTLALVLANQGRGDEAEALFATVVPEQRQLLGAKSPILATALVNWASLRSDKDDLAGAEALLREALSIDEEKLGRDSAKAAGTRRQLGALRFRRGAREEGLALVRDALAVLRARLGDHPRVLQALNLLADLLLTTGDWAGAEAAAREALALGENNPGPEHMLTNEARWRLGSALLRGGRAAEAEPLLARAGALYGGSLAWQKGFAREATLDHGRCLLELGRFEEAESLSLAAHERASLPHRPAVAAWLVQLYEAWGKPEQAARWRAASR